MPSTDSRDTQFTSSSVDSPATAVASSMDDSIKSTYTGTVPVFPPSEQNLVPVGSVEMPENPPDLECEESRDSVRDDSYSSRFWQKAIGGMLFHCCPLNFGVF